VLWSAALLPHLAGLHRRHPVLHRLRVRRQPRHLPVPVRRQSSGFPGAHVHRHQLRRGVPL